MQTGKDMRSYPMNLLHAVDCKHTWEIPNSLTADSSAGLVYALSTLTQTAQMWVYLRFQEGLSAQDTAAQLELSPEAEKQLRKDTLQKLRFPYRWNYIRYGIQGNIDRLITQAQADSFREGYRKGLEDGNAGTRPAAPGQELLDQPIEVLPLNTRCRNALDHACLRTLGDLVPLDYYDIMKIRGLGASGANCVARALVDAGIQGTGWEQFIRLR